MNREDIIRMAREADLWLTSPERVEAVKRFAALVAAVEAKKHEWDIHSCGPTCERYACVARRKAVEAEREACAKVCEDTDIVEFEHCMVLHEDAAKTLRNAAAAIRARGEK